ncbi:hypothetical protein H257_09380 [Aphanomyces astaci]|uniref:HAT C-terminal dimerisation domain-containing protein n=1 Tax=Aphanomyces astaci TaxID=112090 RepID=W4GDD0_APHAT|nr:hypothetical protein H257_09380 [Aphanomyces astaci]ETV76973.1 hypothetical protein H257_09380 [Aphanomyces astaci]|eukprot:XP_009833885.1 hypothetical protein H257_09380 [Aphanomyces astaci]
MPLAWRTRAVKYEGPNWYFLWPSICSACQDLARDHATLCSAQAISRDLEAIKKDVAMHFYITGTSFHRVSQFHLKRAIQRARPDIVLPNRLANKYHEVNQATDRRLGAPDTQDQVGGNDVPRYPNGYPFEHLVNFVDSCKDVVRIIRNNGRLKSALSSLQKANHLGRLVMPAPTRWCTLQPCLVSLHESESLLHDLVSARDFITGSGDQRLRRMVLNETVTAVDVVSKLEHCISILSPIDKWIKIFQSDRVPVSEVFDAFVHQLPHAIVNIWSLNLHETKYIVVAIKARWQFMYGDAHGVGYLLDPRFVDSGFDSMEFKEEELKSKKKIFAEFWMLDGQAWPLLRELALRVFNLEASSAASERNFSMVHPVQEAK